MQQRRQFQRHQRSEFRRLQHHRISGHERGQRFRGRNGERIIPRRDNPDHAIRLAQQCARSWSSWPDCRAEPVRSRRKSKALSMQKRVASSTTRTSVSKRFYHRLAGFARDQRRDFRFSRVEQPLKLAQNSNAPPHTDLVPCWLRGRARATAACTCNSVAHSNSRRVSPVAGLTETYFPGRDLEIGGHVYEKVYAGSAAPAPHQHSILDTHQIQSAGRRGGSGGRAVAGCQDLGYVLWLHSVPFRPARMFPPDCAPCGAEIRCPRTV